MNLEREQTNQIITSHVGRLCRRFRARRAGTAFSSRETRNGTAYYQVSPVVGRDTRKGPWLQVGHDRPFRLIELEAQHRRNHEERRILPGLWLLAQNRGRVL